MGGEDSDESFPPPAWGKSVRALVGQLVWTLSPMMERKAPEMPALVGSRGMTVGE